MIRQNKTLIVVAIFSEGKFSNIWFSGYMSAYAKNFNKLEDNFTRITTLMLDGVRYECWHNDEIEFRYDFDTLCMELSDHVVFPGENSSSGKRNF